MAKLSVLVVALILLVATACSSVAGLLEAEPTSTPGRGVAPEVTPDVHRLDEVVVCLDRSSSYRFTQDALVAVADVLPQLVAPGREASIHLRWIAENSYEPGAHIVKIDIPALPPAPPEPVLDPNPFARRERERQQQEYEASKAAYQKKVAEIRAQIDEQADRLRQLTWAPAQGSDIWGCIQKGSELLGGEGERWLLIASDLEQYGPQQRAGLSLSGVHVRVVFWQADIATQGEQIQQDWRAWLVDLGAAEVEFHDPSEGLEPVLQEWLGN